MTEPERTLADATNILLVDWPSQDVPRALLESEFTVFGYSPHRYSTAELVESEPHDTEDKSVFPPRDDNDIGHLVFRPFEGKPESIDVVYAYRPDDELPGIIERHVKPLGASVLWLHPSANSEVGTRLGAEHDIVVVKGADIAAAARSLRG